MASEISSTSGGFIPISLRMALNAPVPVHACFDSGERSQLCEFSPLLKATRVILHLSLMRSEMGATNKITSSPLKLILKLLPL